MDIAPQTDGPVPLRIVCATWVASALLACSAHHDLVLGRVPQPHDHAASATMQAGAAGTETLRPEAGAVSDPALGTAANPRPMRIDQTGTGNPAGLSPDEARALMAGGPIEGGKWLYPYDGTVFPRGTVAPLVMWHSDTPPDVVYLHIQSKLFDYAGVLRPAVEGALFVPQTSTVTASNSWLTVQKWRSVTEPGNQLAIPQQVWDIAGQQSLGKGDPVTLELTERVNGQIHGPLVSHITIAQAAVKGSLYYNTCLSSAAGADAVQLSKSLIMRIPAGGTAEQLSTVTGMQCIGCHSVSADGSRIVAERMTGAGEQITAGQATNYGLNYELGLDGRPVPGGPKSVGAPPSPTSGKLDPWAAFGAVYPDGSKYLSTSGQVPLHFAPWYVGPAALYDTTTGEAVADTGIPTGAVMPMFSVDGRYLVFNDVALDSSHGLAVMDYDLHNHKATGYRPLVREDPSGAIRPGWPAFLPDNKAVVFVRTPSPDFSGNSMSGANSSPRDGSLASVLAKDPSDLYIADMATGKVTLLAKAMGFNTPADAATDASTYLPFGSEDLHRNYYPTVAPAAAGGYFWLFFDSLRHFGNLGPLRVLWGVAIDIRADGNYALDPSHPPFYVPGQEFSSTSHFRAFSALDRCQPKAGAPCKTGIDCCSGFCTLPSHPSAEFLEPVGTCSPPPLNRCAQRDERCATAADCCDSNNYCINGFCAYVPLL